MAFGAKQESKQAKRHEVLGYQRLRLLSCLEGWRSSNHFEPGPDEDVMTAFREWTVRIVREYGATAGPSPDVTLALLGAARLLSGDLSGANVILENLPEQPYRLDHGAGYCLVQPLHALSTALPLPPHLQDVGCWLAGSTEQAALRAWLAQHRDELAWDEPRGVYTLPFTLADVPRLGLQPLDLPARPQPRHPLSPAWLWVIALLIIGAAWFYWRDGNAG